MSAGFQCQTSLNRGLIQRLHVCHPEINDRYGRAGLSPATQSKCSIAVYTIHQVRRFQQWQILLASIAKRRLHRPYRPPHVGGDLYQTEPTTLVQVASEIDLQPSRSSKLRYSTRNRFVCEHQIFNLTGEVLVSRMHTMFSVS